MKLYPFLSPYINIFSRWIKDLNIRPENMKFVENVEGTLQDTGVGSNFFGYDPKSTGNQSKTRKMGLFQTQKLIHNEQIYRAKRHLIKGIKYMQAT